MFTTTRQAKVATAPHPTSTYTRVIDAKPDFESDVTREVLVKTKIVKVLALAVCLHALSACTDIVRRYKMSEDEAASFFLRFGFDSTVVLSRSSPLIRTALK